MTCDGNTARRAFFCAPRIFLFAKPKRLGYYRDMTHRRRTEKLNEQHVMLFAISGNEHYGDHIWELQTELPAVSAEVIAFAANYYGIDDDEAADLCNPADIVSDAGAWDDSQFVSDLWQALEPVGFRTPDGAVVLDRYSVEIVKIA